MNSIIKTRLANLCVNYRVHLIKSTTRGFSSTPQEARKTPFYTFHIENGGKMINFHGWSLPVMYKPDGIMTSHLHTRSKVSIFDVSHMGQLKIYGKDRLELLEKLVPGDIKGLKDGQMRLTMLTNEKGGVIDDTIVTKQPNFLGMVINGACREKDLEHLKSHVNEFSSKGKEASLEFLESHALIAIQGPEAVETLSKLVPEHFDIQSIPFMTAITTTIDNIPECIISRCGYTGEDGFEVSVSENSAMKLIEAIMSSPNTKLAGLGARDSLRLESGYCLYGNDLNEETTPIEAQLTWTIGKRRRQEGGFLGDSIILSQIKNGVQKKRVGCILDAKIPPTEGSIIFSSENQSIGKVTSSGFSPSLQKAILMGYVATEFSKVGTQLFVDVRGKLRNATIVKMPFVTSNTKS